MFAINNAPRAAVAKKIGRGVEIGVTLFIASRFYMSGVAQADAERAAPTEWSATALEMEERVTVLAEAAEMGLGFDGEFVTNSAAT
jgi:hypothetical protein